MKAACVVLLVLVCGGVYGAVERLNPVFARECQQKHGLSDAELDAVDLQNFDDLNRNQRNMMWCYGQKLNAFGPDGKINVENIPFSTKERKEACAAKVVRVTNNDELLAFVLCMFRKELNLCNAIKKTEGV